MSRKGGIGKYNRKNGKTVKEIIGPSVIGTARFSFVSPLKIRRKEINVNVNMMSNFYQQLPAL